MDAAEVLPSGLAQPKPPKSPANLASGCGCLSAGLGLIFLCAAIFTARDDKTGFSYAFAILCLAAAVAFFSRRARIISSIVAAVAFVLCFVLVPKDSKTTVASSGLTTTTSDDNPLSIVTNPPAPTATPESYAHQRAREKSEFLASVDHAITADKISGNPTKYVGDHVELHCTVSDVFQQGAFNALCGDDGTTNIVIEYADTNALDKGQTIRVLGTVDDPMSGTNTFGGAMNFPTVKAEFME